MHYPTILLLLLVFIVGPVLSDTNFTYPAPSTPGTVDDFSQDPAYRVGKSLPVTWTTDEEQLTLILVQEYPGYSGENWKTIAINTTAKSETWIVSLAGFNTKVPNDGYVVFYFGLFINVYDETPLASSEFFNVSVPDSQRSASPTATHVSTKEGIPSPRTTATATATTTVRPTDTSSSGALSTGAVAGIAVGSTIGGLLLLCGLGFWVWKRAQKGDPDGIHAPVQETNQTPREDGKAVNYEGGTWVYHPPVQTPPTNSPTTYDATIGRQISEVPQ